MIDQYFFVKGLFYFYFFPFKIFHFYSENACMSFIFEQLKIPLKITWIFIIFLSCLSCQSLDHTKKFVTENAHIYKKNGGPQSESLKSASSIQKNSQSPIIDSNYFELQADSAYLKGEEAFFAGRRTEALKHFKKALLFAPNSSHLRKQIIQIYEQEGLFAEALSRYKAFSQTMGKNKEFHQKLTNIYTLRGLNNKALEHLQLLLKQEPDHFLPWFKQALLLIHQRDWTEALKALKTAKTKATNLEEKVQVVLSQSYVFACLQDVSQSLKTMSQLARFQIPHEKLVLQIADFYKSLGQHLLALSYLESFQKTQGVTKQISQSLLDYYISSENWEKAGQQMEHIQALGQFANHHYFYMAMLLMEKQDYDRALAYLKDLVSAEPKQGQYLYFLAFIYEQQKQWIKALETYNQVQVSSPHFLAAQLQAAQLLKQMGQQKKSFSLLEKLSFSSYGDIRPQALLLYSESLWNSKYRKKALNVLTRGLERQPFHIDLLFLRGFYFKQSGYLNRALKDMERILKKQSNHEEALHFIASFYSEQEIHLNTAETMARKALFLKPHSSYFLNTLGWILFQKGNWQSALPYLNQAFVKNSRDSHIAKRLGKVHFQLKNFEKSDYFFKEALRLEKNDRQLKPKNQTPVPKQAFRQ